MTKYRITFSPKGRPGDTSSEVKEVEAFSWEIDSDFIFLYRKEEGKEVRVFGAPKDQVWRIEEITS